MSKEFAFAGFAVVSVSDIVPMRPAIPVGIEAGFPFGMIESSVAFIAFFGWSVGLSFGWCDGSEFLDEDCIRCQRFLEFGGEWLVDGR